MKNLVLPLLLLLQSFHSFAQFTVSGKIINKADKKPISFATAFLNNTSVASPTNDKGEFSLKNVHPGHYQLIISFIGYEAYKANIAVDENMTIPQIELTASNKTLTQVQVSAKFKLSWHFNEFRREFLGTTDFAKQCKILNPDVLHFDYDDPSKTLSVFSRDFFEIENNALGYKIRYKLEGFTKDETTGSIFYEGPSYFEDMKGTPEQVQQWQKNRMHAYKGSLMEFLRSLLTNKMEESGYEVYKLFRKPNPYFDRHRDGNSNQYIQKLIDSPLTRQSFLELTDQKGLFTITSAPDTCLYVRYRKVNLTSSTQKKIFTSERLKFKATISILIFKSRFALFDYNGVITNPASVSVEGYFGEGRIAYQLPDDFEPTD
ncbi:MAG: carboxypeptidase-like regulatory domain-containing protein [Mucilaginibacter sp.]